MGTIECVIAKKLPLEHILTKEEKNLIIKENKDIEYSYLALIKEMLTYETTVASLFRGWGGIQLFKIDIEEKPIKGERYIIKHRFDKREGLVNSIANFDLRGYDDLVYVGFDGIIYRQADWKIMKNYKNK